MLAASKVMGAGGAGGGGTNEFVEYASGGGTVTLSAAPQAGDLLVLHTGAYAFANTQDSAFTEVVYKQSSPWSGSYIETSRIGYKIATGSEGTTISTLSGGFEISSLLAVYRFSSSVVGVSVAFAASQQGTASRSIDILNYAKPNVVVCSVGSYEDPNMSMTDQNYSFRQSYLDAASSLTDVGSTTYTSVVTATDANFNEACTYAVLVPILA